MTRLNWTPAQAIKSQHFEAPVKIAIDAKTRIDASISVRAT